MKRELLHKLMLSTVTDMLAKGTITGEQWKEYAHAWQTGAPRFALRVCDCESCQWEFAHLQAQLYGKRVSN